MTQHSTNPSASNNPRPIMDALGELRDSKRYAREAKAEMKREAEALAQARRSHKEAVNARRAAEMAATVAGLTGDAAAAEQRAAKARSEEARARAFIGARTRDVREAEADYQTATEHIDLATARLNDAREQKAAGKQQKTEKVTPTDAPPQDDDDSWNNFGDFITSHDAKLDPHVETPWASDEATDAAYVVAGNLHFDNVGQADQAAEGIAMNIDAMDATGLLHEGMTASEALLAGVDPQEVWNTYSGAFMSDSPVFPYHGLVV